MLWRRDIHVCGKVEWLGERLKCGVWLECGVTVLAWKWCCGAEGDRTKEEEERYGWKRMLAGCREEGMQVGQKRRLSGGEKREGEGRGDGMEGRGLRTSKNKGRGSRGVNAKENGGRGRGGRKAGWEVRRR